MTPAAVVFDNDGLMLDTEQAWTRAEELLFRRYGSAFTDDHKRDLLGSSRAVAAAKLEGHLLRGGRARSGLELVDELFVLVMAELDHGAPPRPGALELLAALRAAGTPVGLASNSPRAFVDKALASRAWRGPSTSPWPATRSRSPSRPPTATWRPRPRWAPSPGGCVALEDSPHGRRRGPARRA